MSQFAGLLETLAEGAIDHQLNVSRGGATLVVVRPKDRDTRFVLTIGLFHREGKLPELNASEIDEVIAKLEAKKSLVHRKVAAQKQVS